MDAPCQKVCKSHSRFTKLCSWTSAASSLPATEQRRQPCLCDLLLAGTDIQTGLCRCWHPIDRLRSGLYSSIPVRSFLPPPLQGSRACAKSPFSFWPSTSSWFTHFGKLHAQEDRDWSHPNLQCGNCPVLLLSSSDLAHKRAVLVGGPCAYGAGAFLISTVWLLTSKQIENI